MTKRNKVSGAARKAEWSGVVSLAATMAALVLSASATPAVAQQAADVLPSVTVDAPAQRQRTVRPRVSARSSVGRPRPTRSARRPTPPLAAPTQNVTPSAGSAILRSTQSATGPVDGFVATRTATGTKTNTPVIEVPQSITTITRDQIDQQRSESASQALRYTAGVVSETRASNNRYDSIIIRGFGGAGNSAGYVSFWDGMRLLRGPSYLIPAIDPYSLERIDVLRGPSSVLFGQANLGGLVNLVSKRPTEAPFHEIELQTGSYQRAQAAFDLSGPADPDGHLLYRLTALARDANTQVNNTGEQRILIAPSFTWRPDASTTLTVYGHYQRDPETGFYGTLPVVGSLYAGRAGRLSTRFFPGEPTFEGFSRDQAHAGIEFETSPTADLTFRSKARLLDADSKFETTAVAGVPTGNDRLLPRRNTYSREFLRGFTTDNQAQISFDTGEVHHVALAGIDYLYADSKRLLASPGVAQSLDVLNPIYGRLPFTLPAAVRTNQEQSQLGVYGQEQMKWDRWVLTGGLRGDFSDVKVVTLPRTVTDTSDKATTGRVGLVYLFDNGLAPYASYATSFEPALGVSFAGTAFKPTTGEQYEAGLKYQPPGYNAFIQFAAFDLTQNNVLTPDPTPGRTGFSVQTGQIRSQGIEVEGRATLNRNIDLIATYATAAVKVTEANDTSLGRRPITVPAQTASGWGYYTFRDGPLSGLGFGGGVRYVGSSNGAPDGSIKVGSYTLFDAAVSYDLSALRSELKGFRLAVNATNLADKVYVSSCFSLAQGCVYGLRRSVLATLTYRW